MQSPEAYYDAFHAKKRAKVLLFYETTKYFCKKNTKKLKKWHFICVNQKILLILQANYMHTCVRT
jgi:hypothetical protein